MAMPYRTSRRLRRALLRRGLTLEVGRVRDPAAIGYGQCVVRDAAGRTVRTGTMVEIEHWLAQTSPSGQAYTRAEAYA